MMIFHLSITGACKIKELRQERETGSSWISDVGDLKENNSRKANFLKRIKQRRTRICRNRNENRGEEKSILTRDRCSCSKHREKRKHMRIMKHFFCRRKSRSFCSVMSRREPPLPFGGSDEVWGYLMESVAERAIQRCL